MTSHDPQPVRVTIPEGLMKVLGKVLRDPEFTPTERIESALIITFGYAFWEQAASIDPRLIQIPSGQWNDICQALIDGVGDDEANRVNLGLNWVNQGPSAFEEKD